jgi:CBS domain-containing protein
VTRIVARNTLVRDVMTKVPGVLTFTPDMKIEDAARALAERKLGGAPVVDAGGRVVGLLEDDDLIVQETRLHAPTVITVLGAYIPLGSQHDFEEELRKAVGATVGQVMDADPEVCREDDTLERVATLLHDKHLSRLPVVASDGTLVGIVSRGDLVRALLLPQEG